jgi:MFS family permease
MIPASLFLGFTASILWCAEGTYLTHAAKCHAIACDISEESAIGSFNGEFWAVFASNQVVGNLITLALLYYAKGTSGVSSGTTLLLLVFLGSMAIGTALAFFLTPQESSYTTISEEIPSTAAPGSRDLVKRILALLHEKKMVLLIFLLVYTGFQQAFIWGDFTKDIITPAFGVAWVGGVMALYGASDVISSVVAGRFSTGLPAIATIICVGATAQAMALVLLLFKQQYGGGAFDYLLLSGLAIAWGIGDATFNTQISALLGIFYPDDTEAAFAQWKIWQSAATSAAFFASPRLDFFIKLYVLLALLVLSMAAFIIVILRHIGWRIRML